MAKSPKPKGRNAVAAFSGAATGPLSFEVSITDPEYTVSAFPDDIKFQRVWFVGKADAEGWLKLVYSADGPEGDPWQVGKIRFTFSPDSVDPRLKNLASISVGPAAE